MDCSSGGEPRRRNRNLFGSGPVTFRSDGEPIETGGREDRLLPWARVRDIAGISRTTAWRMQQTGDFPAPVPVSPGRVGWWESELTAWKGARSAAKPLAPPSRPRLPGMPRRAQVRSAPAITLVVQPDLSNSRAGEPLKPREPKRGRRAVHVDQIDFGF